MTIESHATDAGPSDLDRAAPAPILVVEDDPAFSKLMQKRLMAHGYEVLLARDGLEGLEFCRLHRPDLVLSDWMMPKMNGVDLCEEIRKTKGLENTYIILISSKADTGERVRGFDAGADDYLVKNCDPEELQARIRVGLRVRELQKALERQARVDDLTGLWNRAYFYERLSEEIPRVQRYGKPLTVAMIDLDGFKGVNDTFGHLAGDGALVFAAELLMTHSRTVDVVGRYGGDEFVIAFVETDPKTAVVVMERIRKEIADHPFQWEGRTARFGMSFGMADLGPNRATPDLLLRAADEALYEMKRGS